MSIPFLDKQRSVRPLSTAALCALRGTCAAVALLLIGTAPTAAQLRYRSDSAHGRMWRRLYSQLPAAWKARDIVYVREVPDADMDRFVERFDGPNSMDNSVVDGCYQGGTPNDDGAGRITLRQSLQGENAALVFIHEYGHYVWDNMLTAGDRARYRRIWREQKRGHSLITGYAGESDEEGFAEAFAYFIHRSATLQRVDGRSWSYFADLQEAVTPDGYGE